MLLNDYIALIIWHSSVFSGLQALEGMYHLYLKFELWRWVNGQVPGRAARPLCGEVHAQTWGWAWGLGRG